MSVKLINVFCFVSDFHLVYLDVITNNNPVIFQKQVKWNCVSVNPLIRVWLAIKFWLTRLHTGDGFVQYYIQIQESNCHNYSKLEVKFDFVYSLLNNKLVKLQTV